MRFGIDTALAVCMMMVPAALTAHPRAVHLGGGGAIDVSLWRIVISFVICVIIAALAILLIRQRSGKIDLATLFARIEPRAREINVVETRRLSPHADICLVRQGGRDYLILLQQGSAAILRDQPSEPADVDTPCA